MARHDWLNANQGRAYPFQETEQSIGGFDLPYDVVLDFDCVFGYTANFISGTHKVWLAEISRAGDTLTFAFASDAPGLVGLQLLFTRDLYTPEYATEYREVGDDLVSSSSEVSDCAPYLLWEGFLTTGNLLDSLGATVLDGDTISFDDEVWVIEPARTRNLYGAFVNTLNLANTARTVVNASPGCVSQSVEPSDEVYVAATCITGDPKFVEGYHCQIRLDTAINEIEIAAVVGGGAGSPCNEVPRYPGESPPAGSNLLSGGFGCGDVIRSLNGVIGPDVRIIAHDGVRVSGDPVNTHKLIIAIDLNGMARCVPDDIVSSLLPTDEGP